MIPRGAVRDAHSARKPRVCGDDPYDVRVPVTGADVNPACAGMILTISEFPISGLCKPRVCGDDPY